MTMKTTTIAVLGLACALSACSQTPGARPAADNGKITEALKAAEAQWNLDIKSKDPAKFAGHYAADAVAMNPGAPPMTGPAAIQAGVQPMMADPNFSLAFSPDKVDVSASGDLAYTRGRFTLTMTDPATHAKAAQAGSYVTVYRKQADGSWKAVEDIASPGAMEAPAAAPAAKG
jgi:uncharacterized protein (TIGR02246 family)